jgi:hypothetical protein
MTNQIKGYCNQHFYTDVQPYEVVEVISEKKVVIRAMREIRKTDPIIQPGGFAGHCLNNREIEYEYESIPGAPTKIIKLLKKGWDGGHFIMSDRPIYFYDYNF